MLLARPAEERSRREESLAPEVAMVAETMTVSEKLWMAERRAPWVEPRPGDGRVPAIEQRVNALMEAAGLPPMRCYTQEHALGYLQRIHEEEKWWEEFIAGSAAGGLRIMGPTLEATAGPTAGKKPKSPIKKPPAGAAPTHRMLNPKKDAAWQLGISVRSLERFAARGLIRFTSVGGRILFHQKELERFAGSNHYGRIDGKEPKKPAVGDTEDRSA